MYWWNTKKLTEDIKCGELSEQNKKSYYIGTTVLYLLSYYIITALPATDARAAFIEGVGIIMISVIGINLTFKTNKGNAGIDFIGRSLALAFPLLIKIIVIAFFYGIAVGIAIELFQSEVVETWAELPFSLSIQVWYFWRLNVHLKAVNT